MKRSEMLGILGDAILTYTEIGPLNLLNSEVDVILTIIENAGMLPPTRYTSLIDFDNEWEPENET